MHKNYYYDSATNTRRALIVDISTPIVRRTRLMIRDERGQGTLLLNKVYKSHRSARAVLARFGDGWKLYKRTTY